MSLHGYKLLTVAPFEFWSFTCHSKFTHLPISLLLISLGRLGARNGIIEAGGNALGTEL